MLLARAREVLRGGLSRRSYPDRTSSLLLPAAGERPGHARVEAPSSTGTGAAGVAAVAAGCTTSG